MRALAVVALLWLVACSSDAPAAPIGVAAADAFSATDGAVGSGADVQVDLSAGVDVRDVHVPPEIVQDVFIDPCITANCNDGNVCTTDGCTSGASASGCTHVNNTASCDDGFPCTLDDKCAGGACAGPACGDGICSCTESFASCPGDCPSSPPAGTVLIPAGTLWMGCNATKDKNCNADEKPQHQVTLSAYYIDLTETTVAEYKSCVDAAVCTPPSFVQPTNVATYPGLLQNPVNNVSWLQAQLYCKWRGVGFDLPTEAQWEMAARGSCEVNGSTAADPACAPAIRTYPWGDATATCSYAVMAGDSYGCGTNATWAVGSILAGDSPYGLHDMAGNVWEWTRDWYSASYYSSSPATDPYNSASASHRVFRGGSFANGAVTLHAGSRGSGAPSGGATDLGFRCARSYP